MLHSRTGACALLSMALLWSGLTVFSVLPDALHAADAGTEDIVIENVDLTEAPVTFEALLARLATGSFSDKRDAIDQIVAEKFSGSRAVLDALLNNALHADNDTDAVLIVSEDADGNTLYTDAASGMLLVDFAGASKRITTNNGLRKQLRGAIARFDLDDPDPEVRMQAVKQLREDVDPQVADMLRAQQGNETEDDILEQIAVILAIVDLDSDDAKTRMAAVEQLQGELGNDVYNTLHAMADDEPDSNVKRAIASTLNKIEGKRSFYSGLETTFFGLSFGSVLVLSAIGLAITFGVMGVINMAHGEMMMLGAYTTFVLQRYVFPDHIGLSILVAIPAAFVVAGLFGIAIERGIVRFLYGRPLETLLATFGVSLVLQQLVRSVFGTLNQSVQTPEMMSGLWQINEIFAITYNRLYILIFTLIVFAGLLLILNKTSLGLKVRAVSQNRQMAKAMGVRTDRVDALTFGLGSGVAGIAGVALSQLTNVGPNLGQGYIIDSFMVVVFGGVGNLWGTLIGGFGLGIFNKILEPYAGAVLAKILILVFIILFIQRRKQGLFPQKGRAAEDH